MKLDAKIVTYNLKRPFTISRGSRNQAEVIQVRIEKDGKSGLGECSPTGRYGETFESVLAQIESLQGQDFSREQLLSLLPPGAARNGIDCALWDWEVEAFPHNFKLPQQITTAMTVSIGSAKTMADEARAYIAQGASLIKVKLNEEDVYDRLLAVREAAPDATIIVDANEAWESLDLNATIARISPLNIAMIEQPLPAGKDELLRSVSSVIPLCADESCHTAYDIDDLVGKYQMVNIKLDKTGGLTAAFELEKAARAKGMQVMVGCMLGSSIAMQAALPIAAKAILVDLDGAFLISDDIPNGLIYRLGRITL